MVAEENNGDHKDIQFAVFGDALHLLHQAHILFILVFLRASLSLLPFSFQVSQSYLFPFITFSFYNLS